MAEVTTKTLKISEVREAEGDYGTFYWVNTNEGASYTISGAAPQVAEDLGKYLNRPVKVLVQKGKGKYDKVIGIADEADETPETVEEVTPPKPNGQVPPEVWENKDRRITRMSVLKTAVDWLIGRATYLEAGVTKAPDSNDVLLLAKKFENFVYQEEPTKESAADVNELPF